MFLFFILNFLLYIDDEALYINYNISQITYYSLFTINYSLSIDIFLNFRTAFLDYAGNPVYDSKSIAIKYWQTGFLLDIIGTIPFDAFTPLLQKQ